MAPDSTEGRPTADPDLLKMLRIVRVLADEMDESGEWDCDVVEALRMFGSNAASDGPIAVAVMDAVRRILFRPRVWLTGDEVPPGVWALDQDGRVRRYGGRPAPWPLVEVRVPEIEFDGVVIAERSLRAARETH